MGKKKIDNLVFVYGYLMLNTKGTIDSIIYVAKKQIEEMYTYTLKYEGYFLKILDRTEYTHNDEIISYENQDSIDEYTIGEKMLIKIKSKNTKVLVPLVIDKSTIDFIKSWKEHNAILRRYPQEDSTFYFGKN